MWAIPAALCWAAPWPTRWKRRATRSRGSTTSTTPARKWKPSTAPSGPATSRPWGKMPVCRKTATRATTSPASPARSSPPTGTPTCECPTRPPSAASATSPAPKWSTSSATTWQPSGSSLTTGSASGRCLKTRITSGPSAASAPAGIWTNATERCGSTPPPWATPGTMWSCVPPGNQPTSRRTSPIITTNSRAGATTGSLTSGAPTTRAM